VNFPGKSVKTLKNSDTLLDISEILLESSDLFIKTSKIQPALRKIIEFLPSDRSQESVRLSGSG